MNNLLNCSLSGSTPPRTALGDHRVVTGYETHVPCGSAKNPAPDLFFLKINHNFIHEIFMYSRNIGKIIKRNYRLKPASIPHTIVYIYKMLTFLLIIAGTKFI